jgi:dTMP kinase
MNRSPLERARASSGVPRGFFVTLEGIEGSGKSSHVRRLADSLTEAGYPVFLTREPGGTPLGEAIRGLLLGVDGDAPSPEAELYLILAARAQHVNRVILPRLNRGDVVLCDRFADATLAYQGGGRGLGFEPVAGAGALAAPGLTPDLTILCDVPVEEALTRVGRRRRAGGDFNRFDREEREFHEAVRAAYLRLAAAEPGRFRVVSTEGDEIEIARALLAEVEPRLAERRREGGLI